MIAPDNLLLGTSSWACSDDRLLKPFLKCLPKDFKFALEIRNKNWISWDRKEIEAKTARWDRLIEDKTPEMTVWIQELKKIVNKGVKTYAFFNNHYAGFAPGSVKQFEDLWQKSS